MLKFTIKQLCESLTSQIIFHSPEVHKLNLDDFIADIVIDTRQEILPSSVFVAIIGDNYDAHDYLEVAIEKGVALAVVSKYNKNLNLAQIVVSDTRCCLGLIAKKMCDLHQLPMVAITGSSGKTTTKFILNSLLKVKGKVFCSPASFNNDLGVPLTLFSATKSDWAGIFEIGTNHPGEIAYLSNLITKDVAILNNISSAHIGNFKDLKAIAHEKSDIFNLIKQDGWAVIPYETEYSSVMIDKINTLNKIRESKITLKTFGFNNKADIYADNITVNADGCMFDINYSNNKITAKINLLGKHQVLNSLAASLAAIKLGLSLEEIKTGLSMVRAVDRRMSPIKLGNNIVVIDDSYNASPASVTASIDFLSSLPGEKIFVLGDLGELGEHAQQIHINIGLQAKNLNIDKILAFGNYSKYTLQAFSDKKSEQFADKQDLSNTLLEYLNNWDNSQSCTILIKGSNSMRMWEVTELLQASHLNIV